VRLRNGNIGKVSGKGGLWVKWRRMQDNGSIMKYVIVLLGAEEKHYVRFKVRRSGEKEIKFVVGAGPEDCEYKVSEVEKNAVNLYAKSRRSHVERDLQGWAKALKEHWNQPPFDSPLTQPVTDGFGPRDKNPMKRLHDWCLASEKSDEAWEKSLGRSSNTCTRDEAWKAVLLVTEDDLRKKYPMKLGVMEYFVRKLDLMDLFIGVLEHYKAAFTEGTGFGQLDITKLKAVAQQGKTTDKEAWKNVTQHMLSLIIMTCRIGVWSMKMFRPEVAGVVMRKFGEMVIANIDGMVGMLEKVQPTETNLFDDSEEEEEEEEEGLGKKRAGK
jgi:hypothetical protein